MPPLDAAIDRYCARLARSGSVEMTSSGVVLELEVDAVDIGGAPDGLSLRVNVGTEMPDIRLASEARGEPPSWLTVSAPPNCTRLSFDHAPCRQLTIEVFGQRLEVAFNGTTQASSLRLTGDGGMSLFNLDSVGILDLRSESQLAIDSTTLRRVDLVTTAGKVRLNGRALTVMRLELRERTALHLESPVEVGEFLAQDHVCCLSGSKGLTVLSAPRGGEFQLLDGVLEVGSEGGRFQQLIVAGNGVVNVRGSVSVLTLRSIDDGFPIQLRLAEKAEVLNLIGAAEVEACNRSRIVGSETGAFAPYAIHDVSRAEIENLNPFNLRRLNDLDNLEQADRITFWLPGSTRAVRKAADRMFDHSSKANSLGAPFWDRLGRIMAKNRESARDQSLARYLSARYQRRASLSKLSPHSVLQGLYATIGYGELAVRPLGIYGLIAVLLASWFSRQEVDLTVPWDLTTENVATLALAWWQVLQSPLAYFEIGVEVNVSTATDEVLLVAFQVIGILLIVVSLRAIARKLLIGRNGE